MILTLALPTPLRQCFDYLPPENYQGPLHLGMRLRVPFGRRQLIGILVATPSKSSFPTAKLKRALEILEDTPCLTDNLLHLCHWASQYYHYPIGETFSAALPKLLRQGHAATYATQTRWTLTAAGRAIDISTLKRAKLQSTALKVLQETALFTDSLNTHDIARSTLNTLEKKGWVSREASVATPSFLHEKKNKITKPKLNSAQQKAVEAITSSQGFQPFLLDGVTGSGKTEIYLRAIEQALTQGKQCLILVPEIGLTPQTLTRFANRFDCPIAVLHSNLSDRARLDAWLAAKTGLAKLIIGTRSAVFTPLPDLGLIIIDEEHDASFKQQETFRYSARDLALVRAQHADIPIVLGSATPSLESFYNVEKGRYHLLRLPERAGGALKPTTHIIDIRHLPPHAPLSPNLIDAMKKHLSQNQQVLLFINRRGYAPVLMCHHCGWIADCESCDAHLTLHLSPRFLQCHHCGRAKKSIITCPTCQAESLFPLGTGTEKLESLLADAFPDITTLRIDRDSTRKKNALETYLQKIREGGPLILIGTQMLAKGHHFPNVTLVGIVGADGGFFSSDFRACERLGQLVTQVAGRAGRAEKPGEVYLQTRQPNNPLLKLLLEKDYHAFAKQLLEERRAIGFPPYAHLALFRAQAKEPELAKNFLEKLKRLLNKQAKTPQLLLGPIPAALPKRAGYHRQHLLLHTQQRSTRQHLLKHALDVLTQDKTFTKKIQWTLDVDPAEVI